MTEQSAITQIQLASPSIGGPTCLYFATTAAAQGSDTLAITLANYGASGGKVLAALVFVQTTAGSVVVQDTSATTSVTSGVLTIAFGSGNNSCIRTGLVWVV